MKQETIQDFTRRISNANRTALVVIKFDMFDEYINSAVAGFSTDDRAWKDEVRRAAKVLESFKKTLDFKYELSVELYAIYHYCEKLCYKALSLKKEEPLREAAGLMKKLGDSFRKLAENDDSPVLMDNSQQIIAGMTYGRGTLYEGTLTQETNRGFWA